MSVNKADLQAPVGAVFDRSTEGSVERNLQPILSALSPYFARPEVQRVLELASGFGQHVQSWARAHPKSQFKPTDRDPESVQLAQERIRESNLENVAEPLIFDVLDDDAWSSLSHGSETFDMLVCINLIHVSPWAITQALFRHVNEVLSPSHGLLVFYGAFKRNGKSEDSNNAFDQSLRQRDTRFGLRDMEDVEALASEAGFKVSDRQLLPSNNWLLVFQRGVIVHRDAARSLGGTKETL